MIGAVLIVAACGLAGLTVAHSYITSTEVIKQLVALLQLLETEISYTRTVLPDICARAQARFPGAVGEFLAAVEEYGGTNLGGPFSTAWQAGLAHLGERGVPAAVLDDLAELGWALGSSGVEEQRRYLEATRRRLEEAHRQAEDEMRANCRLWGYLGFACGLLILLLIS